MPILALLPRPRRVRLSGTERVLAAEPTVSPAHGLPAQGYRLNIAADGVRLEAADPPGEFYARRTLAQLRTLHPDGQLPVGTVEDWPDLPVRGAMVDVSRCRVPTLERLLELVERLANLKVNHLELYMEHTFAYEGHREVWAAADPFDADDMARLQSFCAERFVELVPNQNTLGHMERWLLHERYSPLGILRGVGANAIGLPVPASTLDPAHPGSARLAADLVSQLSAAVPAGRFHAGLDEPWDLPSSRVSEWAGWVEGLRRLPALEGRELLVWADMLAAHPEMVESLPAETTLCEWGYDAGHPFADRLDSLGRAGHAVWLCPGTSSWISFAGRVDNAVTNCREAASAAAGGAAGLLVTDWGDFGHHQAEAVSDVGFAAAAAFSWCLESNRDLDAPAIGRLLDIHSFRPDPRSGGRSVGSALVALGNAYRAVPCGLPNVSALTLHLYFPQLPVGSAVTFGLQAEHLDAAEEAVSAARRHLERAVPASPYGRRATAELGVTANFLDIAIADARARLDAGGHLAGVPATVRNSLAERLRAVIQDYRATWPARSRPGGLEESCAWLEHLLGCYETGVARPDWAGPLVDEARRRMAARR
ncbi:MAG TPA: glycoside hydrolase family 20 zincin-like fold domain-containing protein [Acidimicrobiales bacterium]|nr:glycoside hydrolase family 20 zincin-like fold domain-containing protein [Acidimicrobiales bacterium]